MSRVTEKDDAAEAGVGGTAAGSAAASAAAVTTARDIATARDMALFMNGPPVCDPLPAGATHAHTAEVPASPVGRQIEQLGLSARPERLTSSPERAIRRAWLGVDGRARRGCVGG